MRQAILAATTIFAAALSQDSCQTTYNQCIAFGQAEVKCSCGLADCLGEGAAGTGEWGANAVANLATSITQSSTSTSSAIIITGTTGSQPSGQAPITAAEGSLLLGETCSDDRQCANGVQCWGSNAGTIRRCGNFNAGCSNDSQCAYNTCNNGLCNGFLPSSAFPAFTQSKTMSIVTRSSYTSTYTTGGLNGTQPSSS